MTDGDFLEAMIREALKARNGFPKPILTTMALMEEVGELSEALLDKEYAEVRKEAVQVAVMAMRVAVEGDASVHDFRLSKGLDYPVGRD